MRKEIYLIKGETDESYSLFSDRMLALGKKIAKERDTARVKLTLTTNKPPKLSVIPFKKKKIAAISVWSAEDKNRDRIYSEKGYSGVYLVKETLPVSYEKTWQDGIITPGVCLLTLFRKREGIDYHDFIHRWHNGHTPLSLKIHPLWNYNRNVVQETLTGSAANWDGIVEEHFRTQSDLLNPFRFFGNPLIMIYRMAQVYFDTKSFLDYKTIEPYYAAEIHLKS